MKIRLRNIDGFQFNHEPDGSLPCLKELVGEVQPGFWGGLSNSESHRMEAINRQNLDHLRKECSSMTLSTHLRREFFFPTNNPSTTTSTELSSTFFRRKHSEPSGRLTFHLHTDARSAPLESTEVCLHERYRADDYWIGQSIERVMSSIVALEREGKGRMASFYIVYVVEDNFRKRRYGEINQLLKEIEIAHLTEWSLIALLRSSFSARLNLPAWNALRDSARKKLEMEGKSARKLLRGLI